MKRLVGVLAGSLFFLILTTRVSAGSNYINPVSWKTDSGQFSSSNFYIRIKDKYFYAPEPVKINMPTGDDYSTIELMWKENSQDMRLFMYFKMTEDGSWQMYDLRTYNFTGTDWIYYATKDVLGNPVTSIPGQRNFYNERLFKPLDNTDAEIYCKDCSITTFSTKLVPLSSYGYGIDFIIGLPSSETITITNDPTTGYGVNAQLIDSKRSIVKDQSTFKYDWKSSNTNIATVYSQPIDMADGSCAYNINPPCPKMNSQISGKNPGIAQIILNVIRTSDNVVVASASFDVKVLDKNSIIPNPSPTSLKNDDVKLKEDIKNLQLEVGKINKTVESQSQDISLLRKILMGIQDFLNRFFGLNR